MDRKLWGPYIWHILHTIAKTYPAKPNKKDKFAANKIINLIAYIIPCPKCKIHYMQNITRNAPKYDNNASFFKWTVKIHNIVNKSLKKKIVNIGEAYKITPNSLNSRTIQNLFRLLSDEVKKFTIPRQPLIQFIDYITYFINRLTQVKISMNNHNNNSIDHTPKINSIKNMANQIKQKQKQKKNK